MQVRDTVQVFAITVTYHQRSKSREHLLAPKKDLHFPYHVAPIFYSSNFIAWYQQIHYCAKVCFLIPYRAVRHFQVRSMRLSTGGDPFWQGRLSHFVINQPRKSEELHYSFNLLVEPQACMLPPTALLL